MPSGMIAHNGQRNGKETEKTARLMTERKTEIPLYTKVGIRVTAVLMLVISIFLIRNCTTSVYFGATTPEVNISEAYEKGVADGRAEASGMQVQPFEEENPALKKAYQKGFRTGWDEARKNRPNTLSPTSKAEPISPTAPQATPTSAKEGK